MFKAKTDRIEQLASKFPHRIEELRNLFDKKTCVYIDHANVRPWCDKLGWHIDLKRLKQFLCSFQTVCKVKIFLGTLTGDKESEQLISDLNGWGFHVKTKPVKIMHLSIERIEHYRRFDGYFKKLYPATALEKSQS